ncbi:hypothetical protein [Rhodococcus pyridinivorans]|uniref:hypothetical protein n=1 Tax=Rhodococcus pyridinivorans TaxID=103816 RepID=UPI000BA1C9A2|nr:hypothetical protein [Rhodococcus pyridinivorans]
MTHAAVRADWNTNVVVTVSPPQVADEPAGEERAEVDAVGRLALAGDHRCGLDEVGDDRSEQGRQDCSTYRDSRTASGEMFHLR